MATPAENERRLDEAQRIIREVWVDVRREATKYDAVDRYNLTAAWTALDKVTLVRD